MKRMLPLCVVVSGSQPRLGVSEVESAVGAPLRLLDERIGLVGVEESALEGVLAKLYECVLLQEAVLAKAWRANPAEDPGFYAELAASGEWSELSGRSFAVSVRKLGGYPPASTVDLAAAVAEGILRRCSARVNLEEPDVRVRLVVSRGVAVVGTLLFKRRGDRFRFRSKRYKPFKHPASLTPEDAKVLVNLTACGSLLLDPFCGSGSVVIEACLSGLEAVGLDVDRRAARGARDNMIFFSCDARGHVVVGDACVLPFRDGAFDAIATNPPYGRSAQLRSASGRSASECLLQEGFRVLKEGGRVAYISPLSPESGSVAEGYVVRVHGGLARSFVVKVKGGCAREGSVPGNRVVDAH